MGVLVLAWSGCSLVSGAEHLAYAHLLRQTGLMRATYVHFRASRIMKTANT